MRITRRRREPAMRTRRHARSSARFPTTVLGSSFTPRIFLREEVVISFPPIRPPSSQHRGIGTGMRRATLNLHHHRACRLRPPRRRRRPPPRRRHPLYRRRRRLPRATRCSSRLRACTRRSRSGPRVSTRRARTRSSTCCATTAASQGCRRQVRVQDQVG